MIKHWVYFGHMEHICKECGSEFSRRADHRSWRGSQDFCTINPCRKRWNRRERARNYYLGIKLGIPTESDIRNGNRISKPCFECGRLYWSRWRGKPRRHYICPDCFDGSPQALAKRGRDKARELYPNVKPCERCGSTDRLQRHHKDENPNNNRPENIEFLCWDCHMRHHKAFSYA